MHRIAVLPPCANPSQAAHEHPSGSASRCANFGCDALEAKAHWGYSQAQIDAVKALGQP
jgi:hypothetical protein